MIKKIILWTFLIALLVLAVLSYVGYRSFNQEAFKNQIVRDIADLTGRTLIVNGPAQLTWDPLPTMTLSDVDLQNVANSPNKNMFHADKIQIQIEWASLLKTTTRIKSIVVTNPQILVERLSMSSTNMNFEQLFRPLNNITQDSLFGLGKTSAQVDVIHIENAFIKYINQITKQTYQIKNVTGNISVGSISGPFQFSGQGLLADVMWQIHVNVAQNEISKPTDFTIKLTEKESQSVIDVNGQIFSEGEQKHLSAYFNFKVEQPNTLFTKLHLPLIPNQQNTPSAGSATLEIFPENTKISDLIFKLGADSDAPAFNINLDYQNTTRKQTMALTSRFLNLDQWWPTIQSIIDQKTLISLPETAFQINISDLTLNNDKIPSLIAKGDYVNQAFHIDSLSTLLPGSTTIQAQGILSINPENPNGAADINIDTQDLQTLLTFIKFTGYQPPENSQLLKQANIHTLWEWTPDNLVVESPDYVIDGVKGQFHYDKPKQDGVQNIVVTASDLNLNQYFPPQNIDSLTPATDALQSIFQYLATVSVPSTPTHYSFKFSNTLFRDVSIVSAVIDATIKGPQAIVESLIKTAENENMVMQAEINQLGTADWHFVKNNIKIQGNNPLDLLTSLGLSSDSVFLKNARQFTWTSAVTGSPKNAQMTLAYKTNMMELKLSGSLVNNNWQGATINLSHTNAPRLLQNMLTFDPFPRLNGTLDFKAELNQDDDHIFITDMKILVDTLDFEGQATYTPETHQLNLTTHSEYFDLAKLLPEGKRFYLSTSGFNGDPYSFDLFKFFNGQFDMSADTLYYRTHQFANAHTKAHIANNVLTIEEANATLPDNSEAGLSFTGSLNWNQKPEADIKISTTKIPVSSQFAMFDNVGLSQGDLTSNMHLIIAGETPLEMARALSGNGDFKLENTSFVGVDFLKALGLIEAARPKHTLSQNFETNFSHDLTNGVSDIQSVSGTFNIKDGLWQMANGTMLSTETTSTGISADWDIPTASIKAKIPLAFNQWQQLPAIIYSLAHSKRGLDFNVETKTFVQSLIQQFANEKSAQEAASVAAKKQEVQDLTTDAKEKAEKQLVDLKQRMATLQNQMTRTPDTAAQKELKQAQMILQSLPQNKEDLRLAEYQYIITQTNLALTNVKKAEQILFDQQLQVIEQQASSLLPKANDLILEMNQMYQKRPALSLLAELISHSEKQRGIMNRAINQFKKKLSPDQIRMVSETIQKAYDKIEKAHDYANDLYTGRKSMSFNKISRATP